MKWKAGLKMPQFYIVKKYVNDNEVDYVDGPFKTWDEANIMLSEAKFDNENEYYEYLVVKTLTDVGFC